MKKIMKIGLCALLLTIGYGQLTAQEQDIVISNFVLAPNDLAGSVRPEKDNSGEYCSTILFYVRDTTFVIESNVGLLKRESGVGFIRIWLPRIARRLTVKKYGLFPLEYEIPERMSSKASYHAYLWAVHQPPIVPDTIVPDTIVPDTIVKDTIVSDTIVKVTTPKKINKKPRNWKSKGYVGLGFNALSILGPTITFGVDMNQHVIELGVTYGINKTDNLYLYKGDDLIGDYRYHVIRAGLRYGYDIRPIDWMGIMPQVGAAINRFDIDVADVPNNTNKESKYTTTASAYAALRISFGKSFKFQVTPEYDFGIYKSNHYKLVSEYDDNLKKWTDGFGINAGIILNF